MNDSEARSWMRRMAADTPALATPGFEEISARACLEAAFESRARAAAPLDWIDAAWQSLAISGVAALTVWLGELLS